MADRARPGRAVVGQSEVPQPVCESGGRAKGTRGERREALAAVRDGNAAVVIARGLCGGEKGGSVRE